MENIGSSSHNFSGSYRLWGDHSDGDAASLRAEAPELSEGVGEYVLVRGARFFSRAGGVGEWRGSEKVGFSLPVKRLVSFNPS